MSDTEPAPLVHLVCGSTGAGKTTYALALTQRTGAVRFSIDEWMTALFWVDAPQPLEAGWAMERVARCTEQIWAVAGRLLELGAPVVLDLGFTTRAQRDASAGRAEAAGQRAQLHFVDVPAEERWRRVQARNAARGETYRLEVSREMFDFVEAMWEPPGEEEMRLRSGVRAI